MSRNFYYDDISKQNERLRINEIKRSGMFDNDLFEQTENNRQQTDVNFNKVSNNSYGGMNYIESQTDINLHYSKPNYANINHNTNNANQYNATSNNINTNNAKPNNATSNNINTNNINTNNASQNNKSNNINNNTKSNNANQNNNYNYNTVDYSEYNKNYNNQYQENLKQMEEHKKRLAKQKQMEEDRIALIPIPRKINVSSGYETQLLNCMKKLANDTKQIVSDNEDKNAFIIKDFKFDDKIIPLDVIDERFAEIKNLIIKHNEQLEYLRGCELDRQIKIFIDSCDGYINTVKQFEKETFKSISCNSFLENSLILDGNN